MKTDTRIRVLDVVVTAGDIENADPSSPHRQAIALALGRALGEEVTVSYHHWGVRDSKDRFDKSFWLPSALVRFRESVEAGLLGESTSFRIPMVKCRGCRIHSPLSSLGENQEADWEKEGLDFTTSVTQSTAQVYRTNATISSVNLSPSSISVDATNAPTSLVNISRSPMFVDVTNTPNSNERSYTIGVKTCVIQLLAGLLWGFVLPLLPVTEVLGIGLILLSAVILFGTILRLNPRLLFVAGGFGVGLLFGVVSQLLPLS